MDKLGVLLNQEQYAIDTLKRLSSEHELYLPNTDSLEILNMAIEALEKQIPKKVKSPIRRKRYSDCPICGIEVSRLWIYCPECGQKLNWIVE